MNQNNINCSKNIHFYNLLKHKLRSMAQLPSRLESVIQNGYDFKLGEYISKGFNIFSRSAGSFIGFVIVYFFIVILLSLIPFIGQIASSLISGALTAGFYIVAHKTDKIEYPSFSNFFDGFQNWGQLVIASILIGLITIIFSIPAIIYLFKTIGFEPFADRTTLPIEILQEVNFGIFFLLILLPIIVSALYIFTPLFIVFDKMEAWSAMEASRKIIIQKPHLFILFGIVWILLLFLSVIPLGLGLLATIPAYQCSIYAAWQDITKFEEDEGNNNDDLLKHLIV